MQFALESIDTLQGLHDTLSRNASGVDQVPHYRKHASRCIRTIVGDQKHVDPGIQGLFHSLFKSVQVGDGSHGQIITDDHSFEAESLTQQPMDGFFGQGRGQFSVDSSVEDVSREDRVGQALFDKSGKGPEFFRRPGGGDVDEPLVGIGC